MSGARRGGGPRLALAIAVGLSATAGCRAPADATITVVVTADARPAIDFDVVQVRSGELVRGAPRLRVDDREWEIVLEDMPRQYAVPVTAELYRGSTRVGERLGVADTHAGDALLFIHVEVDGVDAGGTRADGGRP